MFRCVPSLTIDQGHLAKIRSSVMQPMIAGGEANVTLRNAAYECDSSHITVTCG